MERGPSPRSLKDCSLEEFRKSVLAAVAFSSGSECSGTCIDGNTRLIDSTGSSDGSEGSTTRLDSSDGSTTRIESDNECGVAYENPTISLDESAPPDFGDPFEDVFYRTETGASRTVFHFVSKVFYLRFREKMMSDFSLSMNEGVIRCTTHFRGLRCDMKIDNSTSTLTVSGVGHKIWRDEFFPVVARILLAQYVKLAESQLFECINECADGRCRADQCVKASITRRPPAEIIQPLSRFTASNAAYDSPVYTSTPIINRTETQQNRNNMPHEIMTKIDKIEAELKMVKQSVISTTEKQVQELKSSVMGMIEKINPRQPYAAVLKSSSHSAEENLIYGSDVKQSCSPADRSCNQSMDEGFFNNSTLESSQTLVKTVHPATNENTASTVVGQPVPVIITNRNAEPAIERVPQNQQRNTCLPTKSARKESSSSGKLLLIGDSILNGINTKGLVKGVQKHSKGGATVKDLLEDISVYDMRNIETCIIYVGGNDCANNMDTDTFVDTYDQLISIIKASNPSCKIYLCEIAPRGDVDVTEFNRSIEKLLKHWGRQNVYRVSNTHGYFLDKNYIPTRRYYSSDGIHLSHSGVKRLLDAMNTSVKIVVDYELCVFSSFKKQKQNSNMYTHTGRRVENNGPAFQPHQRKRNDIVNTNTGHNRRNEGPAFQPYQQYRPGGGTGRASSYRNSRKQCFGCHMTGHILAECWNVS